MVRKLLLFLFTTFLFLFIAWPTQAKDNSVAIHLFWATGCPHCAKEKVFLESLKQKYPQVEIKDYEITKNSKNLELLVKAGKELSADVSGVPFTVIGKQYFSGYYTDETTGKEIEKALICAIENGCDDLIRSLEGIKNLKFPVLGEVSIKNLSLPVLTFLIALVVILV